jgi:ribosome maturation protein Sdo1
VYKRVVDDVYDEVKSGRRPKPSPQDMREISRVAYEMTRAILEQKNILMTDADRNEMDSLKTKVDYTFAA